MPDISVIVALLNSASTVNAAIGSVVEQRGIDYELLVVDGGSTDGSWEIVEGFGDAVTWSVSERDEGIYDAWNQAVERASGRYICFLGADDRLNRTNALETLFSAARNGVDLVSCMGHYEIPGLGLTYQFGGPWDWQALCRRMCMDHHALFHSRTLFERFGLFDTSYRIAGDYDFLLRCGPDVSAAHVPEALVSVGTEGISQKQVMRRLWERRRAQLANQVRTSGEANFDFAADFAKNYLQIFRRKLRKSSLDQA